MRGTDVGQRVVRRCTATASAAEPVRAAAVDRGRLAHRGALTPRGTALAARPAVEDHVVRSNGAGSRVVGQQGAGRGVGGADRESRQPTGAWCPRRRSRASRASRRDASCRRSPPDDGGQVLLAAPTSRQQPQRAFHVAGAAHQGVTVRRSRRAVASLRSAMWRRTASASTTKPHSLWTSRRSARSRGGSARVGRGVGIRDGRPLLRERVLALLQASWTSLSCRDVRSRSSVRVGAPVDESGMRDTLSRASLGFPGRTGFLPR